MLALPMVLVLGVFMLARVAEPFPGVSPLTPLIGWHVPGTSVTDPEALAILEIARASEQLGDRALWLRDTDSGPVLMTTASRNISSAAAEALADTPVNAMTIVMYPGAYAFLLSQTIRAALEDPASVLFSMRMYVPWLLSASGLGFLAAGWWFRRKRPVDGWDLPPAERPSLVRIMSLGAGIGLASLVVATAVETATSSLLGIEDLEQPIIVALADNGGIVLASFFFMGVVVAPLGEEMFFRGHLFRWAHSRCGRTYAHVLAAFFFAGVHGNAPGIPSYVVAAVVMGWAYERWRILMIPMVAHATVNAVGISYLVLT